MSGIFCQLIYDYFCVSASWKPLGGFPPNPQSLVITEGVRESRRVALMMPEGQSFREAFRNNCFQIPVPCKVGGATYIGEYLVDYRKFLMFAITKLSLLKRLMKRGLNLFFS